MDLLVRKTCPYSEDYIYDKCNVGVHPKNRFDRRGRGNIRQRFSVDRTQEQKAALERFGKRPGRVPWPWELQKGV